MDLGWGEAVASSDAWFGTLDGALLVLETRRVTHLIVKRGAILSKRLTVSIEHLKRWDREGLYLDIPMSELLNLSTMREAEREQFIVVLSPDTAMTLRGGKKLRLKGLRISQEQHSITHFIVGGHAGQGRLLLASDQAMEIASSQIAIGIASSELEGLPTYRRDHDIESDLWEALYTSEYVADTDLKGVRVSVVDSVVTLQGNVRGPSAVAEMERHARAIDGVAEVNNELASDWDVELAVAKYISHEFHGFGDDLSIHSQLGTLTLSGHVPSEETRSAIMRGVPSIAGVRGVEDRIEIRPKKVEIEAVAEETA